MKFLLEETLQDLIRFLRRDSTSERYVMLQLSAWNIMHKDLIPLILTYSQERNLVYHAGEFRNRSFVNMFSPFFEVKLIAFLTLPTEKSATNVQEQNRAHLNDLNALIENEHIFARSLRFNTRTTEATRVKWRSRFSKLTSQNLFS